ncbi:hypothetical protein [Selenomonas artemidis]|jgi:hypothetical protein|uniref:hypothetical protein n=1 Tax=Selenomonas artemidis TaxID=671224 RepID=UPI00040131BE|nr:hypothetical protein [Selenomonas artemidis]
MFDYDAFFDELEKNWTWENGKESIRKIEKRVMDPEITDEQKSRGLQMIGEWLWHADPHLVDDEDMYGIGRLRAALRCNPKNYEVMLDIADIFDTYPYPFNTVVTELETIASLKGLIQGFSELTDEQRTNALSLLQSYLDYKEAIIKRYGYPWWENETGEKKNEDE